MLSPISKDAQLTTILILSSGVLLFFGTIYSVRSILRPSFWGFSSRTNGKEKFSVFTASVVLLLMTATTGIG